MKKCSKYENQLKLLSVRYLNLKRQLRRDCIEVILILVMRFLGAYKAIYFPHITTLFRGEIVYSFSFLEFFMLARF
jgi:hypothetical protein